MITRGAVAHLSKRASTQGLGTWGRLGVAATLIVSVLTVSELGAGSVVQATNDLSLSVSAPSEQLLTDPAVIPVTMTATNPAGGDGLNGFNGSFTAIIPAGATFLDGPIAPAAQSTLLDGRIALFFENVGDIQDGSTLSLDFTFSVAADDFPVGSSVPVEGHFGSNTNPRTVPDFNPATGTFSGDTTGLTPTSTSSTLLTPLDIEKANLTAISNEMVRGVHDHVATYELLVTNNAVADDDLVVVDDFIPAMFEFLGCGGVDNTVDATGTNPGFAIEYPGAAALDATPAPAGSCPTPDLVEMVTVASGVITSGSSTNTTAAPPSVVDGVYTHVRWSLGTLTPAEYAVPIQIQYQVGIPIKQNVYGSTLHTEALGTDPTAYLDNNTGSYTTEGDGSELQAQNFSSVRGTYTGTVAPGFDPVNDTTDEDDEIVSVEDLAIQKSVSVPDPLVQGALVRYDLNIQTSEYRTITAAVITDTLSDGQCPFRTGGTDPEAIPQSGECAVPGNNPTYPFTTVTENADGSFELVWDSSTASILASLPASTVTTLSFFVNVRTSYQENFVDQAPFNGADRQSNEVDIEGTTNLITGIPDNPSIDATPIQDTGSASYQSGTAGIDKSISLPVAPGSTLDCNTASWIQTDAGPPPDFPYAYRIGDRVCFRLGVDFDLNLNYRNARVDDFLPDGMVFEQVWQTVGATSGLSAADGDPTGATGNNAVIIDSIEVFPGTDGDLVTWNLGTLDPDTVGSVYEDDLFVSNGGVRFEVILSAIITEDPADRSAADIKSNLQKFTSANLTNQSVSRRDQADFQVVQPNLRASKLATPTIAVQGQPINYTASVTNIFSDASETTAPYDPAFARAINVASWDLLPPAIACADVSAIALDLPGSFGCVDGLSAGRSGIQFTVTALDPQQTANLTYVVSIPTGTPGGAILTNDIGVRQYEGTPTNDGDTSNDPLFVPADNIDPSLESLANMPAAVAEATITVPAPEVFKELQSSLTDPGNVSNGDFATTTDEATIGETVQYRAYTVVSGGTTLYNASLSDTLPTGMRLVSVDSAELLDQGPGTTTDISGGALGFVLASDATSWSVTFPAQFDNVSGTGDDTITIIYTAIVEDVPGNTVGDDLDNTSQLTFDNAPIGGTPTSVDSDPVTAHLVEPNPLVAKSSTATNPATPGGEIIYTLTATNPAATDTSSAYDVEIVDDVPLGITPLDTPAGALMTADGTVTGPSGSIGLWDATLRTITWTQVEVPALAQVDPDASVTLDYAALLTIPAVADLALVNTADLSATSTPAGNPDERDTYASQSTSTVVPPAATVDKTIPSAQTTYAVGEIVDFEVSFTFPAGTVGFDTTVFDQIPGELTFDSFGTPTFSGPECQIFDPVLNVGIGAFSAGDVISYGPGVGGDSQRIAWFFNELAADPAAVLADCTVTLPYTAHVDTDGVDDGSTFSNSVDLRWNAQDDIAANPVGGLPDGFDDPASTDWDRGDGPASVTIDVAEPQLDVDIDTLTPASALAGFTNDQTAGNDTAASDDPDGTAATGPGGIDGDGGDVAPGELISQRVTVTNNGNADAFDTTVVVTVGPGVTPLDAPAGTPLVAAGPVTGPGGEIGQWDPITRTITYLPADNPNLAAAIAPDGDVSLGYDVMLDASDSLADLQDITDSVDVPTYYGVPPLEQSQPDVPIYGNDATATRGAVDPDETTIEVHFPELGVDKTAISDATDARFDATFTFQFVITNTDAVATAFDVDATDTLPAGWNYVATSAVVTTSNNIAAQIEPTGLPGGPLVWTDLDSLEPGETITIVYDAQPDSTVLAPDKAAGITNTGPFAHTNTVDVVADDATGSPIFDDGTPIAASDDQDVFIRQIDLSVGKAIATPVPPTPIYFGGFVEYEITVTNAGPDDATGVELTDDNIAGTGPADTILFVGVVSVDRGAFDGVTGVWTVGDVAAGETLSLVVRTQMNTVDPPVAPAVNEVEISAADQFDVDSDPANLVSGSPAEDDEAGVSISPLPTTLGNFVWLDLDGDGVQDISEPGIPGVDLVLTWTEPGGQARQVTVTTDSGGAYNVPPVFEDEIVPGFFTSLPQNEPIMVTVQTTSPNLSGLTPIDGLESDVDGGADNVSSVEIDATSGVLLPDGVTLARIDVDFGYQPQPQSLGNRLWWDQDVSRDASDGTDEYGIGGVTVDITWYGFDGILGTADDLTFQTVTSDGTIDVDGVAGLDPAGTWSSFYDPVTGLADRNIPPGLYDVTVDLATLPSGLTVDTFDLDGNVSNGGLTATGITLLLNEQRADVDFSIAGVGVIGDTVWFDHDGDGAQIAGEPGISGVEVQLTWAGPNGTFGDADDAVLTTTTSNGTTDVDGDLVIDPAGTYVFSNLPDGDFEIVVDPAGTSLPGDVTQTGDPDLAVDGASTVTLDSAVGNTVDLDQDFGYQGDLSIGDLLFYDVDGNGTGVVDGPDVPLAGVDVTVTWAGNDGVFGTLDDFATTVTTSDGTIDPLGTYQVDGLPSGDYRVDIDPFTLPAGVMTPTYDDDEPLAPDVITTPNISLTTLTGGDDLDQDFSYTGVGAVGDAVWWDKNEDGVQDLDEPGMPGLTVTLTSPGFDGIPGTGDDLLVTTITSDGTTDVDGDAVIDPPGSYWIPNLPLDVPLTVTVDDTDLATMPATHDRDDTADGTVIVGTPNSATLTLSAAAPTADDVDFGYSGAGAVGDIVWLDLNGDGVQDPGEPGLTGVTVEVSFAGADGIFGTIDDIVETTTTSDGTNDVDGDGAADPAGSYYVDSLPLDTPIRVTVVTSGPDALPAELLPTGDADGSVATPHVSEVTLDTTVPIDRDQDFGYAGPGAVGDTVWYDVDGDGAADPAGQGVFDVPDVALIGVAVTVTGAGLDGVLDTDDDFVINLVTDDNGEYLAEALPYGEYRVEVDTASLPAGVTTQTFDPDPLMDATSTVTLSLGVPQNLDQDFSFTASGAVGDTVWFDQNGDGVQDPGEPGLVGIPITITSPGPDGVVGTADDLVISTTTSDGTTDVDGDLVLDPPGSYYVANLPLDVPLTVTVTDGALPAGLVPVFDADDVTTPHTSVVTLTGATPIDVDQDFGYAGAGSLGDTVFFDRDGIDSGGLPDTAAGDAGIAGVELTLTWTNPTGGLPLVITTTTGDGTTDVDGDNIIDPPGSYSFGNLPEGDYTVTITPATLPAGLTPVFDPEANADLTSAVTLTSAVPADVDRDFSFTGTGSIGDTVWFDSNADSAIGATETGVAGVTVLLEFSDPATGTTFTLTTTTDADGLYRFDNLPAGDYTVSYDPDSLPTGYGAVSDPDLVLDGSATLSLTDGEVRDDIDFGVRPMATIDGVIFDDIDGDGVQGPDEPGIEGVAIEITDSNGDVVTVTTDADGRYVAPDLLAGELTIDVDESTLPDDVQLTTGNDPQTVTAPGGETTVPEPVGYAPLSFINGTIWFDIDAAGDRDTDEPEISGVTVELLDSDGVVIATTTTNVDGFYQFTNIPTGVYSVRVDSTTLPAGLDAQTFDPDSTLDGNHPITLSIAGAADRDFGYTGTGSVSDAVWVDDDKDGLPDAGEPGVGGVSVNLTWAGQDGVIGNADDVTLTGVSDANGEFDFPNLPAGTYRIVIDATTIPGQYEIVTATSFTFDLDAGQDLVLDNFPLVPAYIPITGSSALPLMRLAMLVLAAGLMLVFATRTRRRRHV